MKVCPKCGKQFPDDANFCPEDAGRLLQHEPIGSVSTPQRNQRSEPVESPDELAGPGGVVGERFELIARIGGSLTGEIYRARDATTERTCVVKLVFPEVFPSLLILQRTERELRQLERVQSDGIARVIAHGREDDRLWVASEYIAESESLDRVVAGGGPLDVIRASQIVLRIGQSLADVAKVGVIHRDLAPKNVLLGPLDAIKIINFGVAVPGAQNVHGVAEFVAPEMVEGRLVDQRANIYSLGAVFYFLLAGRAPFVGEPEEVFEQHRRGDVEPPSTHVEVPEAVDLVILKALERASSKRFMTLRHFLNSVEALSMGDFELSNVSITQPMSSRLSAASAPGKQRKNRKLAETMLGGFGPADAAKLQRAIAESHQAEAGDRGTARHAPGIANVGDGPEDREMAPGLPIVAARVTEQTESGEAAVAPASDGSAPGQQADSRAVEGRGFELPPPSLAEVTDGAATPFPRSAAASLAPPLDPGAFSTPAKIDTSPGQDQMAEAGAESPVEAGSAAVSPPTAWPATPDPEPQTENGPDAPGSRDPDAASPGPAAALSAAGGEIEEPGASGKLKGTRKNKSKSKGDKGPFRETMWFKKGELDSAAAVAAQEEKQRTGRDVLDKADFMPMEDRYEDDGSLTSGDRRRFSLKTGGTEMMPAMDGQHPSQSQQVSERELISELKSGRGKIIAAIAVGILLLVAIVAYALTGHGDAPDSSGGETQKTNPDVPTPTPE
ncbi:MAG: protein kinase [Proteobacteria bacterium]|nr:protein kinase [Pseudomonadota bacterium]